MLDDRPFLRLWASWLLASTLGLTLAIIVFVVPLEYLAATMEADFSDLWPLAIPVGLVSGVIVGLSQWLVLRRTGARAARYISSTALSGLPVLVLLTLMRGSPLVVGAAALGLGGAVLGTGQWLALRGALNKAWCWIPASAIGTTLAFASAYLLGSSLPLGVLTTVLLFSGILSATTGTTLVLLTDLSPQRTAHFAFLGAIDLALFLGIGLLLRANLSQQQLVLQLENIPTGLAVSRDGKMVSAGVFDGEVRVWSTTDGRKLASTSETGYVHSLVFSSDGSLIVGALDSQGIVIWSTVDGEKLVSIRPEIDPDNVAVSPDGSLVASASQNYCTVELWRTRDGRSVGTYTPPLCRLGVSSLAYSPNGLILAVGLEEGAMALWDGDTTRRMPGFDESGMNSTVVYPVKSIAFSPDGDVVGAASADSTIRTWKVVTDQKIGEFRVVTTDTGYVSAIALSPDLSTVAVVPSQVAIQVWDVSAGKMLRSLSGHMSNVTDLALSENGQVLVSAGYDKSVRVWGAK